MSRCIGTVTGSVVMPPPKLPSPSTKRPAAGTYESSTDAGSDVRAGGTAGPRTTSSVGAIEATSSAASGTAEPGGPSFPTAGAAGACGAFGRRTPAGAPGCRRRMRSPCSKQSRRKSPSKALPQPATTVGGAVFCTVIATVGGDCSSMATAGGDCSSMATGAAGCAVCAGAVVSADSDRNWASSGGSGC